MKRIVYIALAIFMTASCSIYRKYERPENLPTDSLYRADLILPETEDTSSLGNLPWEEMFTDQYLQALINMGLQNNADLQSAILRVEAAKAQYTAAKLSYLPSVNLGPQGGVSSVDGSKAAWTYNIAGQASWDIDLFGSLLNAKRGAQASLLQQQAYQQAVRSQIIAAIANSYYALLMLDEQLAINTEGVEIFREQVRAMEAMLRAGMINENALTQTRAGLYALEASNAELIKQVRESENSLCTLIGIPSYNIERSSLSEQKLPEDIKVGIPVQLLSNRPDVYQAEMALASAYYTTNQARSAFYPNLRLSGSAGWTNNLGQAIVNPGGWILSAIANLAQPVFNNGKLVANLKVSKAQEEIARINYRQTLLNAGQEVNDALHAIETAGIVLEKHNAQIKELERTVRTSELLFTKANGSYLELLTARQTLLNARLSSISDRYQQLLYTVNLYQALGGGKE